MIEGQYNIFDMLYPKFKIDKPIKTIELFGGYGSQLLSLKYINANVEQHKLCEWAVKSIQAYKDIHFADDNTDYSKGIEIGQIKEFLFNKGISQNYNEPMSKSQIQRLSEKQARTIYNNIKATHNLVNIQQVKGEDLWIKDTDKFTYLLTYSFPCQDLSPSGKRKGMSDTSTRSGMLWEVERILTECKEINQLPQVLLMENVPQVKTNDPLAWEKWLSRLEELGYRNYHQDLIATDYGIPQTRNRTFMVSLLGDYSYNFPKPIPLEIKLKDLLEENVDEKYFLSDKMIKYLTDSVSSGGIDRGESFNRIQQKIEREGIAATITTNAGNRAGDNYIKVKNNTKKGYLEAYDGDGIDISGRMEYHRGTVQREKAQTLTTQAGGVVVETLKKDLCNKLVRDGLVEEGDVVKHSFTQQILNGNKKCVEKNDGKMITLTTRGDCVGTTVKDENGLRIRKLTPRECFRLMAVKDEDFEKCAKNQSDSSLYHLAGDSIVCSVLCHIFKEMI